jgi:FlaA1/EpsC-like NDP-sugar epimerase
MMLTSHAAKVVQTIAECAWSPVQYLFFSENVFDTLVYYAHLVPLLLTMGIGFFVWRYAERNATTKAFLVLALSFAVWTLSDLVLWAHNDPAVIMFFWTLQVVIEPSFGVERTILALLTSCYKEEVKDGEVRPYLALKPSIAPII